MTIARISQLATVSSLLCFCMWITRAPLSAQDRSFTIDQVLNAPFPTDLIAAPSHGRIAWVFDACGRSTLLPFLKAPGAPPEAGRMAWESSPLSSMKTWRSPMLVVQLIESLRKQGVEFEQIVIPDEVHGLILYRNLLTFFEATDDFLHRHLVHTQEQK